MSLVQQSLGSSGLLAEFRSKPLIFGDAVHKGDWATSAGTREVLTGPSSPPRRSAVLNGNGSHQSPTSIDLETPSSSRLASPSETSPQARSSIPSSLNTVRKGKGKSPITSLHPIEIELSWPSPFASRKRPAAGLYNPSMACYANATLQVILHTPPVLRIAQGHDPPSCEQRLKGFCMLCLLKDMATNDHWAGKAKYQPHEAHRSLYKIKKGFSTMKQEDAHEFFRFVTDGLQNTELARFPSDISEKVKRTTWVYRMWGGVVRSRVICSRCQKPSDTFDSFLDLSIDVHNSIKTLLQMLQGFVREDRLEGDNKYHCENCKAKAVASKSFKIASAPPVLTFHLKRFNMNYSTSNGSPRAEKCTQQVEYPERLDIAPFMVDKDVRGTKYRLFGVTCHLGAELRFGHYTSYVRAPNAEWYRADDEDMDRVSIGQVLGDRTAYLLSYIRVGDADTGLVSKSPIASNGVRAQTPFIPVNANRSDPTPMPNGHRPTIIPNDHTSITKRKWENDPDVDADRNANRQTLRATIQGTPPNNYSPKHPPSTQFARDELTTQFGYNPKAREHPRVGHIPEADSYASPNPNSRRGIRGGGRSRGRGRRPGPPMPYHHGQTQNRGGSGFRSKAPGVFGRMQGRR